MPQTTVTADFAPALAGMCAYPNRPKVVDSDSTVNQSGGIPFGRFTCRAGAGTAKLPAVAGDVTTVGIGVSVRDETKQYDAAGWPHLGPIAIARKGYYWVETETAVTKEAAVLVRHTAEGANTVLGRARAGADTGAAVYPNARFVGEFAPGLAIVELF